MIDIKLLRSNPEIIAKAVINKGININIEEILCLDKERRDLDAKIQSLSEQRKKVSKGPNEEGRKIKEEIKVISEIQEKVLGKLNLLLLRLPNIPTEDTPIGLNENDNAVLREVGKIPVFDFEPKTHIELGRKLGLIDTERASKVVGSRFSYLKGDLVLMQFAIIQHTINMLTDINVVEKIIKEKGLNIKATPFTLVMPPIFINPIAYDKMARLEPKEEKYYIPSDDLYLIGSAEHTLGSMHMDEMFNESDLPIRYLGYSTALRREAGAAGKDTRGIIRQHQFDKLEMESFCLPEDSFQEQELFVGIQEKLMQDLGIPYRVIICCTGDMGTVDARHIDIEAWMPSENKYRETHSADLMTDYQARRLNTKVKRKDGKKEFVHMNDATAFAIGRTLITIMENYQQKDGSIIIPDVLRKYINKEIIK